MSGNRMNSVFYAESYHPIQAGSIDGTDILPHDNAVYRALLCSIAGLYDPLGDSKLIGDPYCTVFIGRLSPFTTEDTIREAMSKYGRVKNLRLVRDVVTGASRGYAFVEYESEREMKRAYKDAQHSFIDDCEIIVDYNRQQLMPGWIPRRLGGGLGGKKESGQLRFGGRERPFRAPLRPIPFDDLKRLGIDPPPEGRYMPRFQVPSPPRRKRRHSDKEESSHRSNRTTSSSREEDYHNERSYKADHSRKRSSRETDDSYFKKSYVDREETSRERSVERESYYRKRSSLVTEEEHSHNTSERPSHRRSSKDDRKGDYRKHHKHERQRPSRRDCAE